jgi:hypothetical protein
MSFPTTWWRRSTPNSPCAEVRRSEFDRAVKDEFGSQGSTLTADLVLTNLGNRTPTQALDAGVPAREVWLALCAEADVPPERRYGVGRVEAKKH